MDTYVTNFSEDQISRRDTLERIIKSLGIKDEKYLLEAERYIYKIIENMPSAKQKTGKWIRYKENCLYNKCSVCEFAYCREDNYCPNCGAKMEK